MSKTIHDPAYERIVRLLQTRRRELKISQKEIAMQLGVSRTWVGKVVQRERRLDVLELVRLVKLLKVPLSAIERIIEEPP